MRPQYHPVRRSFRRAAGERAGRIPFAIPAPRRRTKVSLRDAVARDSFATFCAGTAEVRTGAGVSSFFSFRLSLIAFKTPIARLRFRRRFNGALWAQ
jgi:hypothetical protein